MQSRFVYTFQRYALFRFVILVVFFVILGSGISYLKSLNKAVPIIENIDPKIFEKEDTITIHGANFGDEAEDSFLKIDNIVIPSTLCKEWKDKKIVVSASMAQNGGLLFVVAKNTYSRPVFLPLKSDIPIVKINDTSSIAPSIEAISKNSGAVGELIKIYGVNFGSIREESQVIFIKGNEEFPQFLLDEHNLEKATYCNNFNFDFDFWSDEELHIRIPDGASSGLLVVKTKNGLSNSIPFNVKDEIGQKQLLNKKNYCLSMQTEISHLRGEKENTLFLLIPIPEESFEQSNRKTISIEPAPLVENHNGVTIHKLDNIKPSDTLKITHQYQITSYEVNLHIKMQNIKQSNFNTKLYNHYTEQTALLPTKNEAIKSMANNIVQFEKNPYLKAKRIYEYIRENFEISKDEISDRTQNVLQFLESKKGSPYDASLLFASLSRSVGIPAVVVAGIAIDKAKKTYSHWWNAFYIDGIGWIPLDIGMSLGVPFENRIQNAHLYYFGNIDSNRISFSHGTKNMLQMASNSKIYSHERNFALQAFWEEAIGIDSYTCFWQIPQIISVDGEN